MSAAVAIPHLDISKAPGASREGARLHAVDRTGAGSAIVFLFLPLVAVAQNQSPASSNSPQTPNAQTLPRVTTTVEVHADTKDNYLPENVTAGTLEGAPLGETPLSASVVTRGL